VLISTRVRGLLKPDRPGGVNAIEVAPPPVCNIAATLPQHCRNIAAKLPHHCRN
jgi:hypothetical protein